MSRITFDRTFIGLLSICCTSTAVAAEPTPRQLDFFERKIRPVFVESCYECHSSESDEPDGGLTVDTAEALLLGGETGPAVVPGNVKESLLLDALEYRDLEMPPDGRLPDNVIRDFRRWINMGAPDPRRGGAILARETSPDESAHEDVLWSLRPITPPEPPDVAERPWSHTAVDRFIMARLHQEGLAPVAPARSGELLRRVYFDLIGLPPPPNEVVAFERNHSPDALAALVDRLLASPQFGERWGRHWLDVVRYGESAGSSRDVLMPHAWRYRDYVIDAFNDDLPYDRFLTEQLAGDLLPAESAAQRDRQVVATGLLAIGSKSLNGGNLELDLVDDQIDVVGKAMLGLTISCARCHDHKFDPIPTADYYALAGIFKSTETLYGGGTKRPKTVGDALKVYLPLGEGADEAAQVIREHDRLLADLNKQKTAASKDVQRLRNKLPKGWQDHQKSKQAVTDENGLKIEEAESPTATIDAADATAAQEDPILTLIEEFETAQEKLRATERELKAARKKKLPELDFAVGVRDEKKAADSPIHIRGEKSKTGDVVPRGFLSCVSTTGPVPPITEQQSGRLELARWLTGPGPPSHGTRDRQSHLATPLRPRAGRDGRQLRCEWTASLAPGSPGLSGRPIYPRASMVREVTDP